MKLNYLSCPVKPPRVYFPLDLYIIQMFNHSRELNLMDKFEIIRFKKKRP